MWKTVDDMTVEEAESEMYSLAEHFQFCANEGHGISSKETIRYRKCCEKVRAAGRYVHSVL